MGFKSMKYSLYIKVWKAILLSSVLLSGMANSSIIESYTWNANCIDCYGANIGVANEAGPTFVSGSIALTDYTVGDNITAENFSSFTYDGQSNWINPFTTSTVNNLTGLLTDTGALSLLFTFQFGGVTEAEITALTDEYNAAAAAYTQGQRDLQGLHALVAYYI